MLWRTKLRQAHPNYSLLGYSGRLPVFKNICSLVNPTLVIQSAQHWTKSFVSRGLQRNWFNFELTFRSESIQSKGQQLSWCTLVNQYSLPQKKRYFWLFLQIWILHLSLFMWPIIIHAFSLYNKYIQQDINKVSQNVYCTNILRKSNVSYQLFHTCTPACTLSSLPQINIHICFSAA